MFTVLSAGQVARLEWAAARWTLWGEGWANTSVCSADWDGTVREELAACQHGGWHSQSAVTNSASPVSPTPTPIIQKPLCTLTEPRPLYLKRSPPGRQLSSHTLRSELLARARSCEEEPWWGKQVSYLTGVSQLLKCQHTGSPWWWGLAARPAGSQHFGLWGMDVCFEIQLSWFLENTWCLWTRRTSVCSPLTPTS